MQETKISCPQCKHYYTTWDAALPRGCRIFKLKTNTMPSLLVKQQSGKECQAFEKKILPKEKKRSSRS